MIAANLVHFMPGARTHWHRHALSHTVFVTEGVGLCQRRGRPVEVIRPGDRVLFEADEEHNAPIVAYGPFPGLRR